jgi:hypothetical protein
VRDRSLLRSLPQKLPEKYFSAADAPQASDFTAFPEACRAVGE